MTRFKYCVCHHADARHAGYGNLPCTGDCLVQLCPCKGFNSDGETLATGALRALCSTCDSTGFIMGGQCDDPCPTCNKNFFESSKLTNPKDIIGSDKLPMHLWPETATAMGCVGLLNGALKYGRSNWRFAGVRASIYYDAMRRHMDAWFEGEELDPDDGVPHLAAAGACWAIIVDALAADKLNDDRNIVGGWRKWVSLLTPHVARLKAHHEGKTPKHYTIEDN